MFNIALLGVSAKVKIIGVMYLFFKHAFVQTCMNTGKMRRTERYLKPDY